MPELKLERTVIDVILTVAQMIVLLVIVAGSLYNLTQGVDNRDLWISLLSSSIGYLIPSPLNSRHVSDATK